MKHLILGPESWFVSCRLPFVLTRLWATQGSHSTGGKTARLRLPADVWAGLNIASSHGTNSIIAPRRTAGIVCHGGRGVGGRHLGPQIEPIGRMKNGLVLHLVSHVADCAPRDHNVRCASSFQRKDLKLRCAPTGGRDHQAPASRYSAVVR